MVEAGRTSLLLAAQAGSRLCLLKQRHGKHGEWMPWVGTNLPGISHRRVNDYMQLCEGWPTLEPKLVDNPGLTITEALRLLRELKRAATESPNGAVEPSGLVTPTVVVDGESASGNSPTPILAPQAANDQSPRGARRRRPYGLPSRAGGS